MIRNGATVGFRFFVYDKIVTKYCNGHAAVAGAIVGALGSVYVFSSFFFRGVLPSLTLPKNVETGEPIYD